MSASEIGPAAFWLVSQCLNELRQCVPTAQIIQYDTSLERYCYTTLLNTFGGLNKRI
jgi:hypothetical protein